MTTREFWEEEPSLMWAYRKSYMEEKKLINEMNNYNSWLSGLYIYEALNVSLYNCFGRKQGQQAKEYSKQPYEMGLTKKQIEQKETEERENNIKEALQRMRGALKNR